MPRVRWWAQVIAGALLAAAPRAARGDEGPADGAPADGAPAPPGKGIKLAFRIGTRSLGTSPFGKTYGNILSEYGYDALSPLLEVAADVAVSPSRHLDLGVHTGYSFASAGSVSGGSALDLHAIELGAFAYAVFGRADRRLPGYFCAGVEGGAMFPFLVVNGTAAGGQVPYIGPTVLVHLWDESTPRPVQAVIQLRYLIADWPDAFGKVGLPLGGLSLSVGAHLTL
jgi:hypothetical protein